MSFKALGVVTRACLPVLIHTDGFGVSIFVEVTERITSPHLWQWLADSPLHSESAFECVGRLTLTTAQSTRSDIVGQAYQQIMSDAQQHPLSCISRLKGYTLGLKDNADALAKLGVLAIPTLFQTLGKER